MKCSHTLLQELSYTEFGGNVVVDILSLCTIPGQNDKLTQSVIASLMCPTGSTSLTKYFAMAASFNTGGYKTAACDVLDANNIKLKDQEMGLLLSNGLYPNKVRGNCTSEIQSAL